MFHQELSLLKQILFQNQKEDLENQDVQLPYQHFVFYNHGLKLLQR